MNGYYASLSVLPKATRGEIRTAFVALNGHQSAYLTYVVKQLLNPEVRALYDAVPLGSVFVDDYTKRQLSHHLRGSKRPLQTLDVEGPNDNDATHQTDSPESEAHSSELLSHPLNRVCAWNFSYYLLGRAGIDEAKLAAWQRELIAALNGFSTQIAVGLMAGQNRPWDAVTVGYRTVVFLDESEQPSRANAEQAAQRVMQLSGRPVMPVIDKQEINKSMAFRTGAVAAQEASKSLGGNFTRAEYFQIKDDGGVAHLRFITDHDSWITVDQHQNIKTKDKPKDFQGQSWPERMGAVCRHDQAFEYGECYICDFLVDGSAVKKPSPRQWALACLREEVIEDGQLVGLRDATRTVKKKKEGSKDEYEEVTEKAIVIVNMGWKNFFSTLQAYAGMNGTVLDRDFAVRRSGKSTDTTYAIMPHDKIPDLDLRNPEIAKKYESDLDLEEVVADKASDDYYARFFDPRVTPSSSGGKVESTGQTAEVAKPSNDVDEEAKLAAMANRVTGYTSPDGEQEEKPAAASGGMRNFG